MFNAAAAATGADRIEARISVADNPSFETMLKNPCAVISSVSLGPGRSEG